MRRRHSEREKANLRKRDADAKGRKRLEGRTLQLDDNETPPF